MKRFIRILYIITALVGMLMTGCSEDFLDIKPAGTINENGYFSDTVNIGPMMAGVYSAYVYKWGEDIFDSYREFFGSVASDEAECGGDFPNAWGEGYSFDDFSFTAEASMFQNVYGGMFNGISRASEVIEKLPEAKAVSGEAMKKTIDRSVAEAKFLRASFYFVLARTFGGVPIVDHILLASEYNTLPRNTIKEVYDFMEKDLTEAIPYLPLESQIASKDKGHASKGAAQALLAKIYVYESSYYTYYGDKDTRMGAVKDRWKEAYDLCQEIITSGEYELVGAKGETYNTFWSPTTNGYRYLFSYEGNNNKESIFAIQHSMSTGYGNFNLGCALNTYAGPRALIHPDGSQSQNDYAWGFWVPTHKLYNMYDSTDVRRKTAIGMGPDADSGYPGDSIWAKPGDLPEGWYKIANTIYQATGLENMKYIIGPYYQQISKSGWQGNPENMYYLRYADVILMASEAALHSVDQGGTGTSRDLFNIIRSRARNCGDGIHPADLTGPVTKQEIMDERMREFAMEGERFFDLVRWKEAYKVLGENHRMEWWDNSYSDVVYQEPKNDFFPLPAIETTKNSNLKQYAGW